jgi:hypothetical protein
VRAFPKGLTIELKFILFLIILASVILPGCVAQSISNPAPMPANTTRDLYVNEFYLGYDHQMSAKSLFNNATALWDNGDYSNASDSMAQAGDQYAEAGGHFQNMTIFAGNDSEMAFAQSLGEAASGMDAATAAYVQSIDASVAGNNTSALEYFNEGQDLVDTSQAALNQSFDNMPVWLQDISE